MAITHSALNRVTFFDLDRRQLVGALPAQKLPHDMLLSADQRTLYVVNSGSQCMTMYHLDEPELWRYAAAFMQKDSANLFTARRPTGNSMFGSADGPKPDTVRSDVPAHAQSAEPVILNRDPVQSLPVSVASFYLTEPEFPDIARKKHEAVGATSHSACFDCHDRSLGGKPFGPSFSKDGSQIFLVHLGSRNIAVLDTRTLVLRRKIPLAVPSQYSPVEVWVGPDERFAFVTCRNEIGMSKPGLILVVDLNTGAILKSITAGIYPWHLLADPEGRTLYVNNFQSSRISIVDVARQEIIDSIVVQNGPSMMKLLPESKVLIVSCFYTDRVLFVDLESRQVKNEVAVDANPTSLELSPNGDILYVLCGGGGKLDMIDMGTRKVVDRQTMLFGAYAFHIVDMSLARN